MLKSLEKCMAPVGSGADWIWTVTGCVLVWAVGDDERRDV